MTIRSESRSVFSLKMVQNRPGELVLIRVLGARRFQWAIGKEVISPGRHRLILLQCTLEELSSAPDDEYRPHSAMVSHEGVIDTFYVLLCAMSIAWMTLGVSLFYSGLSRYRSALSHAVFALASQSIVLIQWFIIGISLQNGTGDGFVGTLDVFLLDSLSKQPQAELGSVHPLALALFQGMFCCATVAILLGAVSEHGRLMPAAVFSFLWACFVYDPIAFWTWNEHGWLKQSGSLDYAGGNPVHISAGFAALAYSWVLGSRRRNNAISFRPFSPLLVILGAAFMWFGWFGFNGGSALSPSSRACIALVNSQLAAASGAVTWALLDHSITGRWSAVGLSSGVVSGLVCITPAAGFVPIWSAIIFGVVGTFCSALATRLKFLLKVDDALDVFAVHAIGGLVGNFLTGLFASKNIAAIDGGPAIKGGLLIDHNWRQVLIQTRSGVVCAVYTFLATCVILIALQHTPGLAIRITARGEEDGLDLTQMDELAFDFLDWVPDSLGYEPMLQSEINQVVRQPGLPLQSSSWTLQRQQQEMDSDLISSSQQFPDDNSTLSASGASNHS